MTDDAFGYWFAGFTDGEGCFELAKAPRGRVQPQFSINLRADDYPILSELQAAFGGRLHARPGRKGGSPQYDWVVKRKREMAGLIACFDRYPLRAKKAADYRIWRAAVNIYCSSHSGDDRLPALREALMSGRAFAADMPAVVDPFAPQMALRIGGQDAMARA